MNCKSLFESLKPLKSKIDNLTQYLEELGAETLALKSICYDRDRVQTSSTRPTQAEAYTEKLAQVRQKLNRMIDRYTAVKLSCIDLLAELPEVQSQTLKLRYLDFMTVDDVANNLNYSDRQIYTIINQAFRMLDRLPLQCDLTA